MEDPHEEILSPSSKALNLLRQGVISETEYEVLVSQDETYQRMMALGLDQPGSEFENLYDEKPQDPRSSGAKDSKSGKSTGWYPGKYLGFRRRESTQQELAKTLEDTTPAAQKRDSMMAKTLRGIRNLMIARGILGIIDIRRQSGVINAMCKCEVTEEDTQTAEEDMSDVSSNLLKAYNLTNALLRSLENRSQAYLNCEFAERVRISRGITLGVSDPFVGFIAFTISLNLICDVKSLLEAFAKRKEREAAVAAAAALEKERQSQTGAAGWFSRSSSQSLANEESAAGASKGGTAEQMGVNGSSSEYIGPVVESSEVDEPARTHRLSEDIPLGDVYPS
jgi:hypothetical protein